MKLPFTFFLIALLGSVAGTLKPADQDITVGFDFDKAVDALWADLPDADASTDSTKVDYVMGTQPTCGAAAMHVAKVALTGSAIGPDAIKALKATFKIAKVTLGTFGIPLGTAGDVADIMIKYLESNSPEEFAEKLGEFLTGKAAGEVYGAGNKQLSRDNPLKDNPYGKQAFKEAAKKFYKNLSEQKQFRLERSWDHLSCGTVYIIIDVHEGANGEPELFFRASGNCHCKWPPNVSDDQKLGAWQVLGFAPLTPGTPIVKGNSVTIPWSVGKPHYEVTAKCGCPLPSTTGRPTPAPPTENPAPQPMTPEDQANSICKRRCEDYFNTWQDEKKKRESLGSEYFEAVRTGSPAADIAALLDLYKKAIQRAADAELEYYKCLERCYKQAVDNHLIPSVPEDIVKKASPPAAPPAQPANTPATMPNPSGTGNPAPPAPPSPTPAPVPTSPTRATNMIIGVVLPKDVPPGQDISGSVVTNPEKYEEIPGLKIVRAEVPKSTEQTNPESGAGTASLQGVVVDLGDGRKQPADKPLTLKVPENALSVAISVLLAGLPGQPVAQGSVPIDHSTTAPRTPVQSTPAGATPAPPPSRPTPTPPTETNNPGTPAPPAVTMPPIVPQEGVQVIHGATGGDSTRMSVLVDDKPATIVAAKPGTVYWDVPATATPGSHNVTFSAGAGSPAVGLTIAVLSLQMSADNTSLIRGQSTMMHVTVRGLENLPASAWQSASPPAELVNLEDLRKRAKDLTPPKPQEPGSVMLLLENHSPTQVRMGKQGDRVVLHLHKQDFANGAYTYSDKLQSLQSGGFNITGTVAAFLKEVPAQPLVREGPR